MFSIARIMVFALVVLAGCTTTAPRRGEKSPSDWELTQPAPAPPPPVVTNVPPPALQTEATWFPLERWSIQHGLGSPVLLGLSPSVVCTLSSSNGVFIFQEHSLTARWNGLQFWLGFAPQMIDGQFYLHSLDFKKNVEPLLQMDETGSKSNRVIVIDPGHGGGNTGTRSALDGHFEKEFTLDWARRAEVLFKEHGWEVFLTRTNDVDMPLTERVSFADEHKADIFLSLHFNASGGGHQQAGIETYCLTPTGMPSTLIREFGDDVSQVFTNNMFDAQNLQCAVRLHRALLAIDGNTDRGVRRARFMGVLRGQNRPAVLVEGGYLSNPAEARRIADPAFRQKLAEAIAKALE